MIKLVELMGEDKFREGIREYLNTYAYSNATWNDLIRILDNKTAEDLAAFSDVWVNQKECPLYVLPKRRETANLSRRPLPPGNHLAPALPCHFMW